MKKIIIASGPVIVENNKVLLNKHGDTKFWKFCGGTVEDNNDLLETANREAKEEMGIDIKIINPEPFLTYTTKTLPDGTQADVILVHWLAEKIGDIKSGPDIDKWDWLPLDSLPENDLAPNIIPVLKHFGFLK